MQVTLAKPIRPGFRRAFTVNTDAPVENVTTEVLSGDSRAPTAELSPGSTELKGWIYGDGAVGAKQVRITVDGRIGEGEVAITLDISYDVTAPDATAFTNFVEGADEEISA